MYKFSALTQAKLEYVRLSGYALIMETKEEDVLAIRLKKARKLAGLSQVNVGKLFDISGAAVGLWEKKDNTNGTRTSPSFSQLEILSKTYDVPLEYFQGEVDISDFDVERLQASSKPLKDALKFTKAYYTVIKEFAFNRKLFPEPTTTVYIVPDNALAPQIKQGDTLIIDSAETAVSDGFFAIMFNDIPKIKRITIKINGEIVVSDSVNPPESFTKRKKLPIMGRVSHIISKV